MQVYIAINGVKISDYYSSPEEAKHAMWKLADAESKKEKYGGSTRRNSGCKQILHKWSGGYTIFTVEFDEDHPLLE